jgi:NTE family protein
MLKSKQSHKANKDKKKTISLALQGGGAHGAFTWGVLDRLLEEPNLSVDAISATSAGAMNAALYTYGLLQGGPAQAKAILEVFWKQISNLAGFLPLQPGLVESAFGINSMSFSPFVKIADYWRYVLSPYQFNFFDVNPLKDILTGLIDFDQLRSLSTGKVKLFINATDVKNSRVKIFSNKDVSAKVLLASACLPYLSQAVSIDNFKYWDGGFSGNPVLTTLIDPSLCSDILLVQVIPFVVEEVPNTIPEIIDRINEVSFNTALHKEIKAILLINKIIEGNLLKDNAKYQYVRMHSMSNNEILSSLGGPNKLNFEWDFLTYLKELGRQTAEEWLDRNYDHINEKPTFKLDGE